MKEKYKYLNLTQETLKILDIDDNRFLIASVILRYFTYHRAIYIMTKNYNRFYKTLVLSNFLFTMKVSIIHLCYKFLIHLSHNDIIQ